MGRRGKDPSWKRASRDAGSSDPWNRRPGELTGWEARRHLPTGKAAKPSGHRGPGQACRGELQRDVQSRRLWRSRYLGRAKEATRGPAWT